MLLTNDGQWSRRLTQPATKLPKHYLVETENEIGEHYVARFREGFYFAFENLTTQPPSWISSARAGLGWRSSKGAITRSNACSGSSTTRW